MVSRPSILRPIASTLVLAAAGLPLAGLAAPSSGAAQQVTPSPDRTDGEGPYARLIIRGATVIDGTGAPPIGPMDIVVEGNRIVEIRSVGSPGLPVDESRRPGDATREIDAEGMYVLPGFVDLHAHQGGRAQGTPAEYVHKLWLAHGVTTVRDPGSGNGVEWTLREARRSERNEIAAPRIYVYARPGMGWDEGEVDTPEAARAWVRWAAEEGVDGLKLGSHDPPVMAALIDEATRRGLGTQAHLGQMGVARM
ncbi:MAG: amidohydrolase, partial [Gemmatimonadota bacterium]